MDHCINNANDASGTVVCCRTRTNRISVRCFGILAGQLPIQPPTMEMDSAGIGWPLQVAPHSNIESAGGARNVSAAHMQCGTKTTGVVSRPATRTHAYRIANRSANFRLEYVKTSHNVTATLVTLDLRDMTAP